MESTLNLVSVTFSSTDLKEEKKDLMLARASLVEVTRSFSSSSAVTFSCLRATRDSTQEDVSRPEARPLKEIVMRGAILC